MFSQSIYTFLVFALTSCMLVAAHMEMSMPFPLRSKYDPLNQNNGNIDYSNTSPLVADGSNYPCKGYHRDPNIHVVATYTAGQSYTMKIAGSASHGGGSCQLSLSYDNGATFVVVKSMIGGCPLTTEYPFTIPSTAPTGRALFAWTWFNKIGNREMYMNCAVVDIVGTSASPLSGVQIFKANILTQGNCITIEGKEPVFPKRGTDVIYGGDYAGQVPPDDPAFAQCSYAGQAADIGIVNPTSGPQPTSPGGGGGTAATGTSTVVPTNTMPVPPPDPTATVEAPCSTSSTMVPVNPVPTSSNMGGGGGSSTGGSDTGASSTGGINTSSNTGINTGSSSIFPTVSAPTTFATVIVPSSSNNPNPPVPEPTGVTPGCSVGTIRCERNGDAFSLCADNQFVFMGSVAPGTVCAAARLVPRDNLGECTTGGQILCSPDGNTWAMCSGGVYIPMGSVAGGMKCVDGQHVRA